MLMVRISRIVLFIALIPLIHGDLQSCTSHADCAYCDGRCTGLFWDYYVIYCSEWLPCNVCIERFGSNYCGRNCVGSCPAGQYRPDCYTCEPCPAGKYCPGNMQAITCSPGTYSLTGKSSCSDCAMGMYSTNNTCKECPLYTFSTGIGMTICQDCPTNQYNTWTGQTYCMGCEAGKFIT
jgi:hypothetical protein